LRRSPSTGKSIAYVVLPSSREEKVLESFLKVFLRADHRLTAHCQGGLSPKRISIFDTSSVELERAEVTAMAVYANFGSCLVGHADTVWQEKYNLLVKYVAENGTLPSQSCTYEGVRLGAWVGDQRAARKGQGKIKNKMTPLREAALEKIPGWKWEVDLEAWQEKCDLLVKYVEENGALPPWNCTYEGVNLGTWKTIASKAGELRKQLFPLIRSGITVTASNNTFTLEYERTENGQAETKRAILDTKSDETHCHCGQMVANNGRPCVHWLLWWLKKFAQDQDSISVKDFDRMVNFMRLIAKDNIHRGSVEDMFKKETNGPPYIESVLGEKGVRTI
jgi:hypothetical protein